MQKDIMSELTVPLRHLTSTNSTDACYDRIGQRLLSFLKLDNNGMCYKKENDILELLFLLENAIQRFGLHQLSHKEASTAATNAHDTEDYLSMKSGANKRQKKAILRGTAQKEDAATATTEEELILLGITRILSNHHTSLTYLCMEAAATVILALTASRTPSVANAASSTTAAANIIINNSSLEHIAKYSSQWLSSLQKQLESLLQRINTADTYFGVHSDAVVQRRSSSKDENQPIALKEDITTTVSLQSLISCMISCLQAATSTIAYVGSFRISKIVSNSIIHSLNATAWRIVGCPCAEEDITLLQAATTLIASLPLAKVSSWTDTFLVTLASMASVVHRAYPGTSTTTTVRTLDWIDQQSLIQMRQRLLDCSYDSNFQEWLQTFPVALPLQEERVIAINQRIHGLTHVLLAYMNHHHDNDSTTVNFPVSQLLDTCELLLTFGIGAENRYNTITSSNANRSRRGLHKKTTTIPDENAMLSLRQVLQIKNDVRYCGHSLLTASLSTVGSTMLPHARRIATLIEITLLSSCSDEIQSLVVVNNASSRSSFSGGSSSYRAISSNGSIALRSKAIQTAKVAMGSLGSGATTLFMRTSLLIAGCLLETLLWEDSVLTNDQSSWGSISERTTLIVEGLEALSTHCNVSGHILPLSSRSKLEGVVRSAIDTVIAGKYSSTEVKVTLLQLCMSITSTPWIDGGISNLLPFFVELGKSYKHDRDDAVVRNAYLLVNLCNTVSTPRSVPLMNATNIHHRSFDNSDIALDAQVRLNAARKQELVESKSSQQQSQTNSNVSSISLVQHDQGCSASTPITDDNSILKVEQASETKSLHCDPSNSLTDATTNADDIIITSANLVNSEVRNANEVATEESSHNVSDNPTATQAYEYEICNREISKMKEEKSQKQNASLSKQLDDDDDDEFPEIIDCDPDEE